MEIATIQPQSCCSVRVKGDPRSYLRVEHPVQPVWYQLTSIGYELVSVRAASYLEELFLEERKHHVAFSA